MACLAAVLRLACSWSSCLTSCPVLLTACLLHPVLVEVSFPCLGSGIFRFESRRGFALVRGCLSTSSVLGLSWVGSRPVFLTASVLAIALSTVRCDYRRLVPPCWLTASSLLACVWNCAELYSTVQHCTEEPCRTVLGRRGLRAFYEVTPPWVCLGRHWVLPTVSCLDRTRCLVETRSLPGSSRSVLSGRVPFSPSLWFLVRLSSWLALPASRSAPSGSSRSICLRPAR